MGKGKKTFIDRKNAITFHLVHRSQRDPLITDESAPQHVLAEAPNLHESIDKTEKLMDPEKRRQKQQKYGIFYDDDYDYLQHLKTTKENVIWEYVVNPNQKSDLNENKMETTAAPKLQLPSSVFASKFEEKQGLLDKVAPRLGPQLDWDPDVVSALDDDYDFDDEDNLLEDDFVARAMIAKSDSFTNERCSEPSLSNKSMNDGNVDDDEIRDNLCQLLEERKFNDEEIKSRFTEYSMTSSVIRRNEQLTLLDDRFEKFYASYDDPEIGDLAMEEIEGHWYQKHPYLLKCLEELDMPKDIMNYNKNWDKERMKKYEHIVDTCNDTELREFEIPSDSKEKKWDCESFLSTYSNIHNHPKIIEQPSNKKTVMAKQQKIDINRKLGLPMNVLRGDGENQLNAKSLSKLEGSYGHKIGLSKSLCSNSMISALSALSIRSKGESPEVKRERKRLVRSYRNERRIERKANADAFKQEKKRLVQTKMAQQMNLQSNIIY